MSKALPTAQCQPGPAPAQPAVILVRPQSPGNIGAAARAMQNMGLNRLLLVAPERFPHPEAEMMACGAVDLLRGAQVYDSLAAAVAGCHWLLGTSGRRRRYRKPPLTPHELAHRLAFLTSEHQVGILFGPEDTGLTTDDLHRCHDLVVIPTVPEATSLNLAQAVLVICYEIMLARSPSSPHPPPALASVAEIEAMYDHLRQTFAIRGFADAQAVERVLTGLRRLCERAGLERRDLQLLRGIARQLAWALNHPPAPSDPSPRG